MSRLKLRHVAAAWIILGIGTLLPFLQHLNDPDIWWHLKTGQLVWANKAVPTTDPFSYTCFGQPWVAHEWLSQAIFYGVFAHLGFVGLIILRAVLSSAMVASMYLLIRRYAKHQLVVIPLTFVSTLAVLRLWNLRPQMFSYLLVIGLIVLLDKPRSRRIWWAVPMFALWSNLHGVWAFGYVVMAVILLDAIVAAVRAGKTRDALRPVGVLVCSLAAVLIGPQPLHRLFYPISYFDGSIPANLVIEFRPPNFHSLGTAPYALLLLLLPLAIIVGRKSMRWSQWVLVAAMVFFSLKSMRHIPLFTIIAAPIIGMQIEAALDRWPGGLWTKLTNRPGLWPVNLLLLLPLVFLLVTKLPRSNAVEDNVRCDYYPVQAAQFLLGEPVIGEGRVLNPYDWGGYLIFSLNPKYRVSIDGRADVHRKHMVDEVRDLDSFSANWKERIDALHPDVIVWYANHALSEQLRSDSDWMLVHEDQAAVVFIPDR